VPSQGWLREVVRPLAPRWRELVVYAFFVNLLGLAAPIFVLQVYDRVVFQGGLATLQGLAIGMALAIAFDFVLRQGRSRLMQRVALRVDIAVGRRIYEKLSLLPLRTLESKPAAHWLSLFREANELRNLLGGPTAVLLVDIPFAVLAIALIFVIAAPVVWVLALALVAFVLLAWASSRRVQALSRTERDAMLARDALLSELTAGRTTVKALALEERLRPLWEERFARTIEGALARGSSADGYGNLSLALSVATTVVMTAVGAIAILEQSLTIGGLIAANMLSGRVIAPLNQLVAAWRGVATFRQAVRRLGAFFAEPEERRESTLDLGRPKGEIRLENATFSYDDHARPALEGASITFRAGAIHAMIGRNGSGKSTLLKLIHGLYAPSEGRVLIDGADVQQFTRAELARWIGYVPQECFLFAASVRDNIAKGRPEATDAEIIAAAERAGVHEYVIDLPDGYATDIGEAGQRLSAGQRQRLAIARALLGDPPVLLLDEPTASLDRQAEEDLRATLVALAGDHTILIATHSPILLGAAQGAAVLDRGRIVQAGPAAEVIARSLGRPGPKPAPEPQAGPKPSLERLK